jgi:hypothetical protein
MSEFADLTTHRIEGIAREGNIPFSVPLFSPIAENLFMGGCPVGAAPEWIRFIICLYPWEHYKTTEEQIKTVAWLYDTSDGKPDAALVMMLARHVNECRALGPTLVHCQAGLNRSGLITGMALKLAGMSAGNAIDLLRKQRSPAVLCNKAFAQFLMDQ